MSLAPRAVLVHRRTAYAEAVARHGTPGAADFFLRTRGRSLAELEEADEQQRRALATVAAAVPVDWRTGTVERADLSRFLFAPEDVVVVVGQDGLVANVAKYLSGQVVVGIDPAPGRNAGVLVPHPASAARDLLHRSLSGGACEARTMVRASTDDGQELHALNEVFVGHRSHQTAGTSSARAAGARSRPPAGSSRGRARGRRGGSPRCPGGRAGLPAPTDASLAWFVREAWPSRTTGADLVAGAVRDEPLTLDVLSDELVVFGDGLEDDRLTVSRGQRITVTVSPRRLALLR